MNIQLLFFVLAMMQNMRTKITVHKICFMMEDEKKQQQQHTHMLSI